MKDAILEQILNKLKVLADGQENIIRYLEKIDSEREIMEDIREGQVSLKEVVFNRTAHIDNVVKDVQTDIKIQGLKTEDKLEETKEKVEDTHKKIEQVKDVLNK